MWTVWWSSLGPLGSDCVGCAMFSFGIKTMGWRNFWWQLLVRCAFALCRIPSWLSGEGRCCVDGSLTQGWEIIKKNQACSLQFYEDFIFGVGCDLLCWVFSEQVFFLGCPCLVLAGFFYLLGFLYVCVYCTLFFPTCISVIFNFCNGWDVWIAIRIPWSELLFPDHSSAFLKAVMIWELESLFQIQQQF